MQTEHQTDKLPFVDVITPNLVTLDALEASVMTKEVEEALTQRFGATHGKEFLDFVRSTNIKQITTVFRIKPVAQFRRENRSKQGRGTHLFEAARIEDALLSAFTFSTNV